MKKRAALVFPLLILAFVLTACSAPAASTPGDPVAKVETINGQQVDFSKNDVVVIKDYQGKYVSELEPMVVDFGGDGGQTYQVAVFGDVVDFYFWAGQAHSEMYAEDVESRLSNTLITFENAPLASGESVAGIGFSDANGEHYQFSLAADADHKGVLAIADSGKHSAAVEAGHVLAATYKGDGYKLVVEADESQQVQNQPVNYLYLQYDGQKKTLLAQSADRGEDWGESIRNILKPIKSTEEDKVYYETDSMNRANGAGANNHFTRVVDLSTGEDRLLGGGGLHLLLTDELHFPYGGNLILQGHELQDGRLVHNYFMVNSDGETLCYLGTSLEFYESDLVYQIQQAMKEQN